MDIKLLAIDIDGTLTKDRKSKVIYLEAVKYLRKLEKKGVKVSLVSSNALPVVVGLARYFGFTGPCIGETGALVFFNNRIVHLTNISTRNVVKDVLEHYGEYVVESWQNPFRIYEFAFNIKPNYVDRSNEVFREIKRFIEGKYSFVKVGYSGYAIHLTPIDVSKGKAVKFIMDKLGLKRENVAGVGDSSMDVDFLKEVGFSVAVSDSDEELKNNVNLVLDKPGGRGVVDFIKTILEGRLNKL